MCFRGTASKCVPRGPPDGPGGSRSPQTPEGAFHSPCSKVGQPFRLRLCRLVARGPTGRTQWLLPLSRAFRPGRRLPPSLHLGELPSGCPLLSVLWPGASGVIVTHWGQD